MHGVRGVTIEKDVPGGLSPPPVGKGGCRSPERVRAVLSAVTASDAGSKCLGALQILSAVSSLGSVMLSAARRAHMGC